MLGCGDEGDHIGDLVPAAQPLPNTPAPASQDGRSWSVVGVAAMTVVNY